MNDSLRPGTRVDRYRVELPLGEGGMATVYRVRHEVLGTVHALKVLHVDAPRIRQRLVSEGRAQASLTHENVVAVTDVLEVDNAPALLMEFVDGGTLADVVAGPPLPLVLVLRLFRGVVAGVAAAHERGIIHRDLKPGNVLLALPDDDDDDWEEGPPDWSRAVPKVTDFGLAKVVDDALNRPDSGHRTEAGVAMGTPAYMAPEQIRDARAVDHRADLFSLGAVLYAMLTGRSPYAGPDRFAVLSNVTSGRYPPLQSLRPRLPAAVVDLVARCMAVEPADRVQTARALLQAVDALLTTVSEEGSTLPVGLLPDAASTTLDPDQLDHTPAARVTEQVPNTAPTAALSPSSRTPPRSTSPKSIAPMSEAAGASTASVNGLVVDREGRGHAVELVVVLTPGATGVRSPADVDRDASVAAQLAVAVALGARADEFGVRWAARGVGFTIHGTSLGLAIAIAARAALLGKPGPAGWAFTGGIDLDGQIVSVHGVPAKVRAAAAAGIAHAAVPEADHAGLPELPGLTVRGVSHFADLALDLLPPARPAVPWRLGLLLLPVLLAIVDGTSAFDAWVHHPVLAATRGTVQVDDVVLVSVPYSTDLKARRAEYPTLFTTLADGGATGVFFDIALSAESEHDTAIASAIADVTDRGMPVGVPVRMQSERPVLPATQALAEAARLGVVEARQDSVFLHVRAIPARLRDLDGTTWWHLAVWTAAAHVRAHTPPALVQDELHIGPLRNPTFADELTLPPVGRVPTIPLDQVPAAADAGTFRGKAVVVGVVGAPHDSHRTPGGVRSGAEIEAGVVQVLVRQAGVRRVAPEWDALFAAVLGVGTFILGSLARPRVWLAGFVPAAGMAVFVALAAANRVLAPGPALMALVLALILLRTESRRSP